MKLCKTAIPSVTHAASCGIFSAAGNSFSNTLIVMTWQSSPKCHPHLQWPREWDQAHSTILHADPSPCLRHYQHPCQQVMISSDNDILTFYFPSLCLLLILVLKVRSFSLGKRSKKLTLSDISLVALDLTMAKGIGPCR